MLKLHATKYPDTKCHSIYAEGVAQSVASVKHRDPAEQEKLARLFAASPRLLDALIDFVDTNTDDLTLGHYERARAAIAEAEGRAASRDKVVT